MRDNRNRGIVKDNRIYKEGDKYIVVVGREKIYKMI
jgi:hypothetical protein